VWQESALCEELENNNKLDYRYMLKQLIQLQIVKKRRNFKWKNLFLATYFYMLIALIIVSTFAEMDSRIWKTFVQLDWKNIVPIVASMMLLPDILSKLIFKTDSAIMDAYIKSRPISKRTWIYFISITNLFNFWTLAWALPLSIGCFFVMPFGTAFVSALLLLSVSYINSLTVVALRTSQGWEWKWATIVGWLMWWSLTFVHGLNLFGMSWGIHITLFFVLTVIGITTGIYYLQCLNSYDESKRKQETINKSHRSAFFIEMRPFLRGKRLRLILIFPVLLVAQAFWSASMGPDDGDASGSNLLLPLAIIAPSVMVLQLTFALEGNYFDGLWTRPVSIAHLLFRKYYTAIPLTIGSFLLLLPTYFLYGTSLFVLVGSLLFALGFANVFILTYCFRTKAMDIFASGFMNTQGTDFSASSFAIAFTVMIGPMLMVSFLPPMVYGIVLSVLGLTGIVLHKPAIAWIARRYEANRYRHFERYRNK
jgi:putative membrane protein